MNVNLEKNGGLTGKITVTVDAADYKDKVKDELKKFAATHVIPGFRKGHVPMDQLRRRFGKQVKSDVINDLVYREVIKYIRDNKVEMLFEPLPESVQEIGLDDVDYTFAYEIGLRPEVDVVVDKSVTLPFYTIKVTDEMYEEQDKAMRERMGAQVPGEEVEEKAIVKGAIMELNPDGTIKETADAIQVINGIVGPSYFTNADETAKFMGKKLGDKVVFNPYAACNGNVAELSSMLNIDKEKAPEVKADFEFAIAEIIVLRPAEHNQEYFDNVFGKDKVTNEEEYRKAVDGMIANSLIGNSYQLFAVQAEKYFMDKYGDLQMPDEFIKKTLVKNYEGFTEENIEKEYTESRPQLVWQIIRGAIEEKLSVKVERDDLKAYAEQMVRNQFAQYGLTGIDDQTIAAQAEHMLADKDYGQRIAQTVAENKLFGAIQDAVTLDQKEVSLDEFKAIAAGKEA